MEDTKSDNKAQWDHTTCRWEALSVIHCLSYRDDN